MLFWTAAILTRRLERDTGRDLLVRPLVPALLGHKQDHEVGPKLSECPVDHVERGEQLFRRLVLSRDFDPLDRRLGDRAVDRQREIGDARRAGDANGTHSADVVGATAAIGQRGATAGPASARIGVRPWTEVALRESDSVPEMRPGRRNFVTFGPVSRLT